MLEKKIEIQTNKLLSIINFEDFVRLNALFNYRSLRIPDLITFWIKLLDPLHQENVQISEISELLEKLAQGALSINFISKGFARDMVAEFQSGGCVDKAGFLVMSELRETLKAVILVQDAFSFVSPVNKGKIKLRSL